MAVIREIPTWFGIETAIVEYARKRGTRYLSGRSTLVVYLYRWKIQPEKEAQFQKAWAYVTEQLREKSGSLGSRLHRGDDGLWYGYAQWPSVETRERPNLNHAEIQEARRLMKDGTLEMLPDIVLTPVSDFLVLPKR